MRTSIQKSENGMKGHKVLATTDGREHCAIFAVWISSGTDDWGAMDPSICGYVRSSTPLSNTLFLPRTHQPCFNSVLDN